MVKHFAMIAGGAGWRSVELAAFTAYFDASGTEHDQSCLVVAGYVSSAPQWVDFERSWLRRLQIEGLDCFHAAELPGLLPNRASRDALYGDLIEIIAGSGVRQFGCCILNSSWKALTDVERKEWGFTSYTLAARACVGAVREWFRREKMRSLPRFVFERGDPSQSTLRSLMELAGFPAPEFEPKKACFRNGFVEEGAVPLQAADLLAFECFDPVRKIEKDGYLIHIRPQYETLYKIPGEVRAIDLKTMEHLRRFGSLRDDQLWMPNGREEIPVLGLL